MLDLRADPDLVYFLGDAPALEKAASLARHLQREGWRVSLGDPVSPSDPRWANLLGTMQWINTHPLPDDIDPMSDQAQARALLLAAVAKAQNLLQAGSVTPDVQAAYNEAQARYQQYAAQQYTTEMPSALALWFAGLGLDIAGPVAKLALFGAIGLAAYLLLPPILAGMRGGRSA